MKRAVIILLILMLALTLVAASCDPDPTPGGWTPTDGSPGKDWGARATLGAEEFHAQLTAIQRDLDIETEEP